MTCVVSLSLYGDGPKYCVGALKNVQLQREFYPGWTCRIYHDDSVPPSVLNQLASEGAELVNMARTSLKGHGMFWRFLVYDDPDVTRFVIRDADSRLSQREKSAVDEWIASEKTLHVMRDHPRHGITILGGTWGLKNDYRVNLCEMIEEFTRFRTPGKWYDDQIFLRRIYRLYRHDLIAHDDFFPYRASRPFPTPREGSEFIGRVFDENDVPAPGGDRSLLDGLEERDRESFFARWRRRARCLLEG